MAYSCQNPKRTPQDLEEADKLVRVVQACHEHLGAVATVMENPAWPGLLPRRQVSKFLTVTCELNYCAHGGQFCKPTQLWCGPPPFHLVQYGFENKECAGDGKCPISLWVVLLEKERWNHPDWEGTTLAERQAIPYQVSRAVGGAIGDYLNRVSSL